MLALTVVLSTVAVALVGVYLSHQIADGLYQQRVDRVLSETEYSRGALVSSLDEVADGTTAQKQDAAARFIQSLGSDAENAEREAALVPHQEGAGSLGVVATDPEVADLVSSRLRAEVSDGGDQFYQSVTWTDPNGDEQPAIVVGVSVDVEGVGPYQLYILYSLATEAKTLSFIEGAMIGGGAVLLVLLVGAGVAISHMVSVPLNSMVVAAERIAAGDLGQRLEISGPDEIARVGESFNAMAQSLEDQIGGLAELSRLQQRFVSDVSHELRTPLTTIRMAASVIEADSARLPADARRSSELMVTQLDRFESLLADLLEISRFDAGAARLDAQPADVLGLVSRVVEMARPLAVERGCEVRVRASMREQVLVLDTRRVERILRNLVSNALEHGVGRPVEVDVADSDDAVAIRVTDYGAGISPQDARRVFDRFWRADPARARTIGGTGLGLAISLEDASLHGGWLQAWGQKGRGAVFRLTLPRRPGSPIGRSPLRLIRDLDRPEATLEGELVRSRREGTHPGDLPAPADLMPEPGSQSDADQGDVR